MAGRRMKYYTWRYNFTYYNRQLAMMATSSISDLDEVNLHPLAQKCVKRDRLKEYGWKLSE